VPIEIARGTADGELEDGDRQTDDVAELREDRTEDLVDGVPDTERGRAERIVEWRNADETEQREIQLCEKDGDARLHARESVERRRQRAIQFAGRYVVDIRFLHRKTEGSVVLVLPAQLPVVEREKSKIDKLGFSSALGGSEGWTSEGTSPRRFSPSVPNGNLPSLAANDPLLPSKRTHKPRHVSLEHV